MYKKRFLFLIVFISFNTFAQRVYWANQVLDFSSELSSYEYSAIQVLGKPNVMPQGGDNPNAWMPAKPDRLEFVTVGFEKNIHVEQIVIAESYNPSVVYEIYLYDEQGNEYLVNTFDPKPVDLKSRLLRINIEKTTYPVESLRIVTDGRKVPGYSGIDAIGVLSTNKQVEISVELPQNLREDIVVERLSDNVNSQYAETMPLISPDGKTLYYSRSYHPENMGGENDESDIWYSEFNSATGEWNKSKNVGEPLNNKGTNYVSSITPDGSAMTVILGNKYTGSNKMKPGVSVSTKSGEEWSVPQPLDIINAHIEATNGNYFLANNRKVLIMAIERYDAFGGKDIYVSFLQRDNRWTEPLNLGNDINTANIESSPYLAADNETLYFSSRGYSGYGANDVYISRRLDDTWTNWTEPENLGPDINSEGDDVFFNIPPSGKYAYYSKAQEEGKDDIYRIAMPVFYQPTPVVSISGKVVDAATNEPIAAKISYNLLPENTSVGFTMSDPETGEYSMLLPVGSAYDYKVEAEGYKSATQNIDLLNEADFKEIERTISMSKGTDEVQPVAVTSGNDGVDKFVEGKAKNLVLSNSVLFDFASDQLNPSAYPHLDRIATFMKENQSISINIAGHTDNVGPSDYNLSLSKRRAQSVLKYFTKQGLKSSRFTVEGFGYNKPIASNETKEGQNQNRRVEFSIKE